MNMRLHSLSNSRASGMHACLRAGRLADVSLLLALVVAQAGGWGATFPPEATASHFPEHCEQLVIGPSTGWHGEAQAAASALFAALSRLPRCSMRMADDSTNWAALLDGRRVHEAPDWLITVAVPDDDLETATVALYDEHGVKVVEFRAVKGTALRSVEQPVVAPSMEAPLVHHELDVTPISPQLTGASINRHLGGLVSYRYRTAVKLLWVWAELFFGYPLSVPDGALHKGDMRGADALMRVDGSLTLGVELIPFQWVLAPYVYAGGGAALTRHYFGGSVTYLDTGVRPLGELGVGVRWQLPVGVVMRLGGRVMVAGAGNDKVYGCDAAAIAQMEQVQAMGLSPSYAIPDVPRSCQTAHFDAAPADVGVADAEVHAKPSLLSLFMLDLSVGYAF
ncbi:MAG: hypothetical protein QM723_10825 [Myxococcaceae bacterium]